MSTPQLAAVLPNLQLLTLVAETRSFTQAARRLGISKSSVSMRINELERAVGMPLVRRTTRSISLTPAGLQLVDETRTSFVQIERSVSRVTDLAGMPRGLVRMTAPVALGRQHIAPTIAAFLKRYPEIRLEIDLSDRFVNLTQEGFDLAVRHTNNPPDTHVAAVLCPTRSLLVASPEYLRRRGAPGSPTDLAQHDCLLYLRDGGAPNWSFERAAGRRRVERVSVPVSGSFRVNNSEVLREAVGGGAGIGLLPDFSVWGGTGSGSIVQVLADWKPVGFFGEHVHAIRPWASRAPRAVQCVIDHLKEIFAGGFAKSARVESGEAA